MLNRMYQYVIAVADCQSISRAAEALFISQPALTKYINRLEAALSLKLFDRNAKPIALTPAGQIFIKKAREIMALDQELEAELMLLSTSPHGILTVGMTPELCTYMLPYIYPNFAGLYPNIKLRFVEGNDQELKDQLDDKRLDIAFTTSLPEHDSATAKVFMTDTIILAAPETHRLSQMFDLSANSPTSPYLLDPAEIKSASFIICSPDVGMGAVARYLFARYNIEPQIVMELSRNENALRLASAGLGLAFTPAKTPLRIQQVRPLSFFSLEDPPFKRKRYICYRPKSGNAKLVRQFITLFTGLMQRELRLAVPDVNVITSPRLS